MSRTATCTHRVRRPSPAAWPLPIYELALMTHAVDMTWASICWSRSRRPRTLGLPCSHDGKRDRQTAAGGARRHDDHLRALRGSEPGQVTIHPGARKLHVDRVVALPAPVRALDAGRPGDSPGGFISIDPHCKVRRLERVYAAGMRPTSRSSTAESPLTRRTPPRRRSLHWPARRSSPSRSAPTYTRFCLAATSPVHERARDVGGRA